MSNVLEYTLSLKDLVSTKLQKIGIHNNEMLDNFSKLEAKQKKVTTGFKKMGTSVHTLQNKVELLKAERDLLPIGSLKTIRKYNSEIGKLERKVTKLQTLNGSKVKTWFKDALNGLPGIMTNPLVLIGAGVGASVRKGMEADMQKANILTLVKGNADKATKLYEQISKYGIKTPYEKEDIVEAQKTMMSFGIDSEYAFGKLKNIGDIALGDAQKMQSLTLAFSQATSAGKLQGQDLLQMINAGFNPLQVISERTGETMADLKVRMSKGGISAKELAKAFEWATDKQGTFYNGAERASQTLGGKWSNLIDSLTELALKVYDVVSPIITPVIELLTNIFSSIGTGIGLLVDKFKQGNPYIIATATIVGVLTSALILYNTYTSLTAFFQNKLTMAVIKTNLAFLANPVFWIIAGIVALIAAITYVIIKTNGWGNAWKHTVNGAKLLFKAFALKSKADFTELVNNIMIGINKIKTGWYKFKEAVGMGDSSENQKMIAKINADTEARKKAIKDSAKEAIKTGIEAAKEFKLAAGSLSWDKSKKLSDVKDKISAKLGVVPTGLTPTVTNSIATNGGTGNKNNHNHIKTNKAIATGGTKHNYITLNINKEMIGQILIQGKSFKESAKQMEEDLKDALLRTMALVATS